MGKYQVAKQEHQNNHDKTNVEVRKSEWLDQCQAPGCCLKPHASVGGFQLCGFHLGKEQGEGFKNWKAISDAILNNKHLVKKGFELTTKGTDFWQKVEHTNPLRGWDFCPYLPEEWPSQYTTKLIKKVQSVIYEEASQMLEHGLTLGHEEKKMKKKPKGMKSIVEIAEALEQHRETNKDEF